MSKQVMEIEILPNGEVKINVKCVAGPSCEQVSAELEKQLGAVTSKQRTGEFFEDAGDGSGG
jgi:hypothetical protein